MSTLPRSFYERPDTLAIARALIGKVLVTQIEGERTTAAITETEAYLGAEDRASHAFGGKITPRNKVMYGEAGHAYVYLCYGIHHLFNVVTNAAGVAHAVLIRAVLPLEGLEVMRQRRNMAKLTTGGPGTLTRALGITTAHTGTDLLGPLIFIEDQAIVVPQHAIVEGPRIGVEYAGTDALLPYRFHISPSILK